MRKPTVYTPRTIKEWDCDKELVPGVWVPARPVGLNFIALWFRLKIAFWVFTGKYDALNWD